MKHSRAKQIAHSALIAAMYAVLAHAQNILFPESATMMVQFRVAEALCVLAFFTPAAISGLSIGCFLFNLTFGAALPLDPVVGTLATALACTGMRLTRRITRKGIPILGMLLPAIFNGLLVGWELDMYIGGGFWLNCGCVALGETAVLLTLGTVLYTTMKKKGIARHLFGETAC